MLMGWGCSMSNRRVIASPQYQTSLNGSQRMYKIYTEPWFGTLFHLFFYMEVPKMGVSQNRWFIKPPYLNLRPDL